MVVQAMGLQVLEGLRCCVGVWVVLWLLVVVLLMLCRQRHRNQWQNRQGRQGRRRGWRMGLCVVFECGQSRGCGWVGQAVQLGV